MKYKLNDIFKKNLVLIILMIIFIIICLVIKYNFPNSIVKIDENVRDIITSTAQKDYLINIMKIITNFASTVGIIIIFVIAIIIIKDKISRIVLVSNISLIGLLSSTLKILFSRERPLDSIITMPLSYSFPSGHTFFAVGFFGLIVYFLSQTNLNKCIKTLLVLISILIIVLIGISRVYLGVHHFTDVIGGTVLGILVLLMSINTYKVLKEEIR